MEKIVAMNFKNIKIPYTVKQLAAALSKTLEQQRIKTKKPSYPEEKVKWIKDTAMSIIHLIEVESKRFNSQHPGNELAGRDAVSAVSTALNMILRALGMAKPKGN